MPITTRARVKFEAQIVANKGGKAIWVLHCSSLVSVDILRPLHITLQKVYRRCTVLARHQIQNGVFPLITHTSPSPRSSCTYRLCLCGPRNACKLIRSMKSKNAYLKRKRDSQRHRIVEAEKVVGKKIEVRSTVRNLV